MNFNKRIMKKRLNILLFVFLFVVMSCEKEELTGTNEFLIGNWEWEYTIETIGYSSGYFYDTLYPSSNHYLKIEFVKEGFVNFDYNGTVENYRISLIEDGYNNTYKNIYLNNKKNGKSIICRYVDDENIEIIDLPYYGAGKEYNNFYKKE